MNTEDGKQFNADGGGRAPEGPAVDLVDLFGFEDFAPRNRLEQLLVNYANERLQAFHYQQRFGALADQCRRENVAFEPPRHEGNAGCVRLLDGPKGVLGILEDEAARGPLETSDAGFLDKLFAAFTGPMGQRLNPYFGKPKSPAAAAAMFNISHYAGMPASLFMNHVQSELSTWSRSVIASQKQWQASHAEWCTDREVEAKAETALLSAHQKAHDARLAALEQKRRRDQAWAEAKLTRKAEAAAAESDRRRALAGQRNRDGYKRALVEEEYQAARECQREMRRNRRIIEEELRLEAELSREKAASKLQKSRDRIAEAQRSRALLSFERRSAELRKSARELEFEAKKNAWQAAETEQAALILSALNTPGGEATLLADAASSPQAAVLLRDVQRAASMS
ncbi:Myosin heavy chain [Diplonema papillatum]|nr:Myosin heavy chain [Diplonema papillatum]